MIGTPYEKATYLQPAASRRSRKVGRAAKKYAMPPDQEGRLGRRGYVRFEDGSFGKKYRGSV